MNHLFAASAVRIFLVMAVSVVMLAGCGNAEDAPEADAPSTLEGQIQALVDDNNYEEALELLRTEDESETSVMVLLRDTHLLYGNWLMYHADEIHMTERMPRALAQFRRVLQIDPQNSQARANKQQIVEIYHSMGRDVPAGIAD